MSTFASNRTTLSNLAGWGSKPFTAEILNSSDEADPNFHASRISLLGFLTAISKYGLEQYSMDVFFSGTGLRVSSLGFGVDYAVDVGVPRGKEKPVVIKHVKIALTLAEPPDGTRADPELAGRVQKVLKEIRIMEHPPIKGCGNILSILGFGWEYASGDLTTPFLVVEYAEFGTMRNFFESQGRQGWELKHRFIKEVAAGLEVLHSCDIIHGDVKMENILIFKDSSGNSVARLSDFGHSIVLRQGVEEEMYWGTEKYNAPEIYSSKTSQSRARIAVNMLWACDVFSFGLLVWEVIIDGEYYLDAVVHKEVNERGPSILCDLGLQKLAGYVAVPEDISSSLRKVLESSLQFEAAKRDSMEKILKFDLDQKDFVPVGESLGFVASDASDISAEFNVFHGLEVTGFQFYATPWSVRVAIATGLQHQAKHTNREIAAKSALQAAACYYMGFGVERNIEKMLSYMRMAAEAGCVEAITLVERLHTAFGHDYCEIMITDEEEDCAELDREIRSIAVAATRLPEYVVPLREHEKLLQGLTFQVLDPPELDFHTAAYFGDVDVLHEMLKSGRSVNERDERQRTPLFRACSGGEFEAVKFLLSFGADASLADDKGHTPLHMLVMFAEKDMDEVARELANSSESVDVNAVSDTIFERSEYWCQLWWTPLHWAIGARNKPAIKALLRQGARVVGFDEDTCPLRLAASLHLYDILELLLEHSVSDPGFEECHSPFFVLNKGNPFTRLMIHGRGYKEAISKTIEVLERHWDVNEMSSSLKYNALASVASMNFNDSDSDIASLLIPKTNIDAMTGYGTTTLQIATTGCKSSPEPSVCKIAKMLIDHGCDLRKSSMVEERRWNALHWAIIFNVVPVAEAIIARDPTIVNVPTLEKTGFTPLHLASTQDRGSAIVQLLLEAGANPTAECPILGFTPLGIYINKPQVSADLQVLQLLLEANSVNGYVSVKQKTAKWTVLHQAAARSSFLCLKNIKGNNLLCYLLTFDSVRSIIDERTGLGQTALHIAAMYAGHAAVRTLVKSGADIFLTTPHDARPFDILLENARSMAPERLETSLKRWCQSVLDTALFLQEETEAREGSMYLTELHLAAYIGYVEKVRQLVDEGVDVLETNFEGETARDMLKSSLEQQDYPPDFFVRAKEILKFLGKKEKERRGGLKWAPRLVQRVQRWRSWRSNAT